MQRQPSFTVELTFSEAQALLDAGDTAVKASGLSLAMRLVPVLTKLKETGDAAAQAIAEAKAQAEKQANGAAAGEQAPGGLPN